MNILILGQGGREHALAWKISQSIHCSDLFIAPGNGGTSNCGTNLAVDLNDFEAVKQLVESNDIQMVVVGPEAPLAAGLADFLTDKMPLLQVIGPMQRGAQLEASKAFAKTFMLKHKIPTAEYQAFNASQLAEGLSYIAKMDTPIVLKADGLAAGKGVVICPSHEQASEALTKMLNGQFGQASETVVIEQFLSGREFSVFALTDGKGYFLLPEAKDYKRVGEGDQGPNTGGMGAVSPVSYVTDEMMRKTIERVIEPTIMGLQKEAIPYCGFIFFGLIEVQGDPFVIEYNCRMGDPETEAVLPRIKSDLVEHFMAICSSTSTIRQEDLLVSPASCATIMMVSGGYPGNYEKGIEISIPVDLDALVFHAGTLKSGEQLITNGGRVLAVTSLANKAEEAISKSYKTLKDIYFDKQYYRSDIGFDL